MFNLVSLTNLIITSLFVHVSAIDFYVNNKYHKTYNQADIATLLPLTNVAGDVKCLILCQTVMCASLTYSPGTKQCRLFNGNPALVRYGTVSNYNLTYYFNTFLNVGQACLIDAQCIHQKCYNGRCICLRDKSKFDYGLINEWTFNNTLVDSVQCDDLTNMGASFNSERKGYSLYLDGSSTSYLTAPTDYYFIGDFTVTCWFYQFDVPFVPSWSRLFDFGNANTATPNNNVLLALTVGTITTSCIVVFDNTGNAGVRDAANTGVNKWVHVAAVLSGTTANMYINGTLSTTDTNFKIPFNVLRTINYIGKSFDSANEMANAKLINLRFYNRALTPTEIANDRQNMTIL